LYDENIEKIISFMVTHYWYADAYIRQQTDNPEGTGGTYFVDYLWGRFQERWKTAFIRPRSESDFKMFVNKVIRTAAA
ncbi:MAG: hypothetical protein HYX22_01925, partial [Candidatus Yanofskybacteria bacterium]|nr:hypothetical protein [Candidatus Yanofskybacteria bacterium]